MNQTELEENTRQRMEQAPSAGKHATDVERSKQATGAEHGKRSSWCQARENVQPVFPAGKQGTHVKRGKICNRCFPRENAR